MTTLSKQLALLEQVNLKDANTSEMVILQGKLFFLNYTQGGGAAEGNVLQCSCARGTWCKRQVFSSFSILFTQKFIYFLLISGQIKSLNLCCSSQSHQTSWGKSIFILEGWWVLESLHPFTLLKTDHQVSIQNPLTFSFEYMNVQSYEL